MKRSGSYRKEDCDRVVSAEADVDAVFSSDRLETIPMSVDRKAPGVQLPNSYAGRVDAMIRQISKNMRKKDE